MWEGKSNAHYQRENHIIHLWHLLARWEPYSGGKHLVVYTTLAYPTRRDGSPDQGLDLQLLLLYTGSATARSPDKPQAGLSLYCVFLDTD